MQECAAGKCHSTLPVSLLHSITSSARASSVAGISRPSPLAVARLMTSSNLVGSSTDKSLGFAAGAAQLHSWAVDPGEGCAASSSALPATSSASGERRAFRNPVDECVVGSGELIVGEIRMKPYSDASDH